MQTKHLPGGSTRQGAAPVTEQRSPVSSIVVTQHWSPVRPGTFPQPTPPQRPQDNSQQTSSASMPASPLLHTESTGGAAGWPEKRKQAQMRNLWTRATVKLHHDFSGAGHLRRSIPAVVKLLIPEDTRSAMIPDEQPHGLIIK